MRGCRCAVGTDPTGRDRLAGQARHGQNSATTASLRRDAEQAVCAGPPQRPGQALWRKERPVHTGRPGADEMQTRRRPGTGSSGTGQECTAGAQVRTQAARRQAAVTPDQTFFFAVRAQGPSVRGQCTAGPVQTGCRRGTGPVQADPVQAGMDRPRGSKPAGTESAGTPAGQSRIRQNVSGLNRNSRCLSAQNQTRRKPAGTQPTGTARPAGGYCQEAFTRECAQEAYIRTRRAAV